LIALSSTFLLAFSAMNKKGIEKGLKKRNEESINQKIKLYFFSSALQRIHQIKID